MKFQSRGFILTKIKSKNIMNAKQISKELKSIIKEKHKECTTEQQKNKAVNEARSEINKKYGDGWRNDYDDSARGSSWISRGNHKNR